MADDILNKILVKLVDLDESFREFRNVELDEKLNVMENRLISHIDGFIKLHQTLVLELAALRSKNERLEERLQKVELKLGIAAT